MCVCVSPIPMTFEVRSRRLPARYFICRFHEKAYATQLHVVPALLCRFRIKVKTGGSNKRSREDAEGAGETEAAEEKEERGGEKAMKRILDSLPSGLRVVTNFGLVDICPLRSGKHNAAAYLAREHFDIPLANCASMGDDDNDIALVCIKREGGIVFLLCQKRFFCSAFLDQVR